MRFRGLLLLVLVACGGRVSPAPSSSRDAGASPDAAPSPDEPLGVCENRIVYSNDRADVTTTTARFGYDAAGRLVRYVEVDANGKVGISLSRTFDAAGLRRTQDEYTPRIGPPTRKATWDYDEAARPISLRFELSDEGKTPHVDLMTWTYDAQGRRAQSQRSTDGKLAERVIYNYLDGEPRVVEEAHDSSGDGTVDWTWRYGFGAGQWLVFLESVKDGKVEAKATYTYGDLPNGEVIRHDYDTDGDGEPDHVDRFTWQGHHVTHSEHEGALDEPQSFDFAYDGAGRLAKRTWTTPKYTFVTTITYGPEGPARVERRESPSGTLVERWAFTYGCAPAGSLDVKFAPVIDWQRETSTLPSNLDGATYWGFPEAY